MKSGFTNSITRSFLALCILSLAAIGGLQAQNSAYNFGNQNNTDISPAKLTASSPNTSLKIVLDQNSTLGSKVLSGKLIFNNSLQNLKEVDNTGAALEFDSTTIDPQSYQFDLGQGDLSQLYKLLALYKSEAGKGGHTVVSLSRKNQSGKALDSIFIVFKYVVADDLLGFNTAIASVEPVIVAAKINNNLILGTPVPNTIPVLHKSPTEGFAYPDLSGIISLYPNPAKNLITVDVNTLSGTDIRIYNMQGKLVKTVPSLLNLQQHKIDIADLPSGFYILNIDTPTGIVEKKFSKIN